MNMLKTDPTIAASRYFGLMLLGLTLSFGSYFGSQGLDGIVIFDVVYFALYSLLIAATYTRYADRAKEWLMLSSLVQVCALSIFFLGAECSLHLHGLAMVPVAYVVVSRDNLKVRRRLALICLISVAFAETQTFIEPMYDLGEQFSFHNRIITLLSLFAIIYGFYSYFFDVIESNNRLLQHLSEVDELTQLANRRKFIQTLSDRTATLEQDCVLLIDLDKFKSINDTHGHAVGDEVLINVATTLSANCRESDLVARLGGEEFGMLLPNTPLSEAKIVADQLRQKVANSPTLSKLSDKPLSVPCTLSIGVNELGDDINQSLNQADKAMYRSKVEGRNRVTVFAEALNA